jgi:cardiolipin synthase
VELLLPGPHADKRFVQIASADTFTPLFDAGVEIFRFQPSMLHAKIMTVDGVVSNVGSANLNARSTALDEEINVVAIDPDLTEILDGHFDEDLARSERVDSNDWQERSLCERVVETATRPFRGSF